MMKCKNINEVIDKLNLIVEDCKKRQDPLGYFAVLYRKVTIRVKQGIQRNEFEDNQRMENLDVVFANRYFDAYELYQNKQICTQAWQTAFDAKNESGHIILQHILLGINAHINLDLGIAALDACNQQPIHYIQKDFIAINAVLSELVDDVKKNMGAMSPVYKWLMPLVKKTDEMLINFSIKIARDGAWDFATALSQNQRSEPCIHERDETVAMLGRKLRNPGTRLSWVLKAISLAEWRSVASNLAIMEK